MGVKSHFGQCSQCPKGVERRIVYKGLKGEESQLCQFHYKKMIFQRSQNRKVVFGGRAHSKSHYSIRKMTSKRAAIERRINKAKNEYKESLVSLACESCGSTEHFCGISHTISVNDILNSDLPNNLAWDPDNFTWECHDGNNCHEVTEAKKPGGDLFVKKINQNTYMKKMIFLKKWKPAFYNLIIEEFDGILG